MRLSLKNMEARADYLENLIKQKEAAIKDAPNGSIRISNKQGKYQYYLLGKECGRLGKYIKASDVELALRLIQKDYDEKVLRAAKKELDSLRKIIARYHIGTAEDIYKKLTLPRRELVKPIIISDEEYAKRWLERPYTGLGFNEGDPEFYDSQGRRVRSKSEAMISDRYELRGVPNRFEEPLLLKGYKTVYPDFRVLNKRYRKEFVHEHLGMMDDPKYARDNVEKIKAYIKNGYTVGVNLLLTFETLDDPLNSYEIDDLIDRHLV